ncbi:uncharacterized protein A1O9_06113 [Exophiala aquamarina CBS 119918]|uniref:Small ribosomal subunit protein uS4m n=1 Tax=Exophiala aquamarina CBS 119918 TaxID=1182545 RepID=A0A072PEJ4_9EURO|nr:uncharacterized protein A1O9_06113 [Exophiala aquamarina CBS 119918]KEF58187.1 hypothetical protein A1O9_06113 [Exophiala aquamarina CBS 119918]
MARGTRFLPLKTVKDSNAVVKLRQSWSKYNLYNFSRITANTLRGRNFFQTKWKTKSLTRDYHGYQVRERIWERMFSRRLRSVIPMSPEYLAVNDGSNESAGRGSGVVQSAKATTKKLPIPYMQMTYAPLERRLDTAVFRAMFASSIRQARQFVIHGSVKVNGKRMQYPGYLLNPGDMFQVVPDRVMYAAGQPKVNIAVRKAQAQVEAENAEEDAAQAEEEPPVIEAAAEEDVDDVRDPRDVLKELQSQAKTILASPRENIGAKRKQDLRAFTKSIRRLLSRSKSDTIHTDSLEAQFAEIQNQLQIRRDNKAAATTTSAAAESSAATSSPSTGESISTTTTTDAKAQAVTGSILSDSEYSELFAALQSMQENPVDEAKPYATPWMPRDYMSAFAFIPRYLEVNHNICAAVYIRHPVARPGLAEVPTPYNEFTNSSAFTWYLRRR